MHPRGRPISGQQQQQHVQQHEMLMSTPQPQAATSTPQSRPMPSSDTENEIPEISIASIASSPFSD
jgi:hypothetical protein